MHSWIFPSSAACSKVGILVFSRLPLLCLASLSCPCSVSWHTNVQHREKRIFTLICSTQQWKSWECHIIPVLWHDNNCYHILLHTWFLSLYAFASSVCLNASLNNKVSWETRMALKCLQSHIAWGEKKKYRLKYLERKQSNFFSEGYRKTVFLSHTFKYTDKYKSFLIKVFKNIQLWIMTFSCPAP